MEFAAKDEVMRVRAKKITDKYIRDSGPLTVNINSSMSHSIIEIVECVLCCVVNVPLPNSCN